MNTKANNERKNCGYRYRPVLYFAMAYLFTWIFWVPAIFLDGNTAMILMLLGLMSPAVVSTVFILVSGSPALKKDLKVKIFGFYKVKWSNVALSVYVFALIVVSVNCGGQRPLVRSRTATLRCQRPLIEND